MGGTVEVEVEDDISGTVEVEAEMDDMDGGNVNVWVWYDAGAVEDIGKENVTGVDVDVEIEDAADDNVEDVEVRVEDDLVCDAEREQSTAIKLMHLHNEIAIP